jgi:hypothetical protein
MEHLDIGEKRYVKVSSAARETGYTTDYIGQLCRAKKVDAKLVGRTWYVAYDELLAHRQTRGRSSHEKAKKAFKKEVAAIEGETRIPISIEHTGARKRLISEHITYHTDEAALMPATVATYTPENIPEQKLQVTKDAEERPVKFNTEEKPEIKWNGTIVVKSLNEAVDDEITSNSKAKTSPLTRHVHIRNTEKTTAIDVAAAVLPQDPLLQRERFLSRLNRAHDLNTLEAALVSKQGGTHTEADEDGAVVQNKWLSTDSVHAWVYNLSVAAVSLFLVVVLSGFILEQNSIYIADNSGNNNSPYYQKGLSIATINEMKNNSLTTISAIRDMFKNKLKQRIL